MVSNRIKFIANLGESYFPGLAVRVKNNKHKTNAFRAPQAWIMWLVVSSRFHAFYLQVLSPMARTAWSCRSTLALKLSQKLSVRSLELRLATKETHHSLG